MRHATRGSGSRTITRRRRSGSRPGEIELTEEEEPLVEPLLRDLVGARASAVMELLERFEKSHPRDRPHHYLSLLGTHPDSRGQGLGTVNVLPSILQSTMRSA
jgi:GNAT superfamily N-acetyltransferase